MQEVDPPFMPELKRSQEDSFNEIDYSMVSLEVYSLLDSWGTS